MITMTMNITIVDPALDALRAPHDDFASPAFDDALIKIVHEYLFSIMPEIAHRVSIDNAEFAPAENDIDAAHLIECTLE